MLGKSGVILFAVVASVIAVADGVAARVPQAVSASQPVASDTTPLPVVRGLYVNRFAAQSANRMRRLLTLADSTEINAFVIDMKDEFGLNYRSSNPALARNAGTGYGSVRFVKALIDTLKAHGIMPIARVVVFKDPEAARQNPKWTIRQEDSTEWRDHEGLAWVDSHNREVWEYNLAVAEELAGFGFEEIQFDYIRFPEPFKSLPNQVFPGAKGTKQDALAEFLRIARTRLNKRGVRSTADVFGMIATARGVLEVGQHWERLSPTVDVILPMTYPSHYPRGWYGIDRPNNEPYLVLRYALDTARTRDEKLGITRKEHVRAWLQAFTIGKPVYGVEEVELQKRAVYDAGYQGWILWHPGSLYGPFEGALDPKPPRNP